jgi:hypothetical protein
MNMLRAACRSDPLVVRRAHRAEGDDHKPGAHGACEAAAVADASSEVPGRRAARGAPPERALAEPSERRDAAAKASATRRSSTSTDTALGRCRGRRGAGRR